MSCDHSHRMPLNKTRGGIWDEIDRDRLASYCFKTPEEP